MRLFHVSEEADIATFMPRLPSRADIPPIPIVWALSEECLPNFLTPRNCPRVAFHMAAHSTEADAAAFFTGGGRRHVVAVENSWLAAMCTTTLYIYEFDPADFTLQDEQAGYYTSQRIPTIIGKRAVENPLAELFRLGVEVRLLPCLWDLADCVKSTSLAWSLCRMVYARPRA